MIEQVLFYETISTGQQLICVVTLKDGEIEIAGDKVLAIELLEDKEEKSISELMQGAPDRFDGGYLRAAYVVGGKKGFVTLDDGRIIFIGGPGAGSGSAGGSDRHRSEMAPKEYSANLPSEQALAVEYYTASGFREMNAFLRKNEEISEEGINAINNLDTAIASAPPIIQGSLYRSLASSPDELGMEVGKVYQDSGFISTTRSSKYMYTELTGLPTRITIKLPKKIREQVRGINVTSVVRVGRQSAMIAKQKRAEQETILARETRFIITAIKKQGDYDAVTMTVISNE